MGSCPSDMGNCHAVRNRIPAFCSAHYADKRLFLQVFVRAMQFDSAVRLAERGAAPSDTPTQQGVFLYKIVILSKRKLSKFPVFGRNLNSAEISANLIDYFRAP